MSQAKWASVPLWELLLEGVQKAPEKHFHYVDIGSIKPDWTITIVQPLAPEGAPSRARKEIRFGDTIFATVRPYLRNIAFISPALDGEICSTGFCVLRPNRDAIDPRYLYWLARSDLVMNQVLPKMRGVSYPAVSDWEVKDAVVPLPPLSEQRRIVETLEALLSDLEAAVGTLERTLGKLKRYRQAVLKGAVEGDLSREWREAHPDQIELAAALLKRILAERRRSWEDTERARMQARGILPPKNDRWKSKYSEPQTVVPYELPTLPSSWPYVTLDAISLSDRDTLKTGPFGLTLGKRDYRTEGTPLVGIDNIGAGSFVPGFKNFITAEKYAALEGYSLRPGDVIVSRSGTVGQVCVVPAGVLGLMSTNLIRIRVNEAVMASVLGKSDPVAFG